MRNKKIYVVDECPDANGFWTIREADGTPNGNIMKQPIATAYTKSNADLIVTVLNDERTFD